MRNPMHKEIFDYYSLNTVPKIKGNEKAKRAIRKKINELYKNEHPSKTWLELTDVERADFKLIIVRKYILDKILHPENSKEKYKPTIEAQKIVNSLQTKINTELKTMHKPLKFMEEHNQSVYITDKKFYKESATEEENHNAYSELCSHLSKLYPNIIPPSFEEWIKHPQTIFEIREEATLEDQQTQNTDEYSQYRPSKIEILEEIILCLLKELSISIDIESIKHCLSVTGNMAAFNDEPFIDTPEQKDIVNSYFKLQDHDFIIKKD